jgi:hypothetical protein
MADMFNFFKKTATASTYHEALLPEETFDAHLDTNSPTWRYIERWAQSQLNSSRMENDYLKLTELKTAALRGKIKMLKQLIALPLGDIKDYEE